MVANYRYDVILGIPWHVTNKLPILYDTGSVKIGDVSLNRYQSDECNDSDTVKSTKLGIGKFRIMMKES